MKVFITNKEIDELTSKELRKKLRDLYNLINEELPQISLYVESDNKLVKIVDISAEGLVVNGNIDINVDVIVTEFGEHQDLIEININKVTNEKYIS